MRECFGMKIMFIAGMCGFAAIAMLPASWLAAGQSEKKMLAEARIDRGRAERIALAKVHGGTIKSGEIEREKGHLVWFFDIAKPNKSTITEVLVDAKSGKIISVQQENAAKQAAEARADAREKH